MAFWVSVRSNKKPIAASFALFGISLLFPGCLCTDTRWVRRLSKQTKRCPKGKILRECAIDRRCRDRGEIREAKRIDDLVAFVPFGTFPLGVNSCGGAVMSHLLRDKRSPTAKFVRIRFGGRSFLDLLLVLNGLDDALAGGGAGRKQAGEDADEERGEQGGEGRDSRVVEINLEAPGAGAEDEEVA